MTLPPPADEQVHRAARSIVEPLKVICAWCPDFDPRDPKNAEASHGMCPACAKKFKEQSK